MKSTPNLSHSEVLADRKGDHIELAHKARTASVEVDLRFNYEPLFFSHPKESDSWETTFLNFKLQYPLWISSMTGGTQHAQKINENLAKLCGEFKLGMGLGSCRSLLEETSRLKDFNVKHLMEGQPLFANLGIAQVEELVLSGRVDQIHEMMKLISADGLIIHLNPLQEWFQPEGDRFTVSPLETITKFLSKANYPVFIKEVGQGMGPRSLRALLELPIAGIELAAFGGTNFTRLEQMRGEQNVGRDAFISVGHTADEMIDFLNALPTRKKEFIISGGINNMLDGYAFKSKLKANSLIGMASAFLNPAMTDYPTLKEFFLHQRESLLTAKGLLELKGEA